MTARDGDYVQRLGVVLRQRDVGALRAFLVEQAGRYGDERQVEAIRQQADAELEAILHRMIVSRPDLGDLHAESERWLAEAGNPGASPPPVRQPGGRPPKRPGHRSPRGGRPRPGPRPPAT
jgi:hypothetical protein